MLFYFKALRRTDKTASELEGHQLNTYYEANGLIKHTVMCNQV